MKIAMLGAGSWGTAVAVHLAHHGHDVLLWGRTQQHVKDMSEKRCNQHYLPDIIFPDSLTVTHDLKRCFDETRTIMVAVPSHAFYDLLLQLPRPKHGLIWLTKGIDPISNTLFSDIVAQHWGKTFPIGIISGPSFAHEVARFLPTALTLAGNDWHYLKSIQTLLHCEHMRVYLTDDVIGVQLCGAVKNVLAIACGISDGLGYGSNANAALITRGLAEMTRLGINMGASEETFIGLAGVGDLVLTCTDNHSRNRRFGLYLGQGMTHLDAEKKIDQVVEGKFNAMQICMLAQTFGVDMPICTEVNAVLTKKITPQDAAINLMKRVPRE